MIWDRFLVALMQEVADDPTVAGVVGSRVIFATEGADYVVPGLEVSVLSDTVSELWNPLTIQFDIFARTFEQCAAVERVLRSRYHSQIPVTIGGMDVFAQYSDGTVLQLPARDKFFARAVRFTFTPLRAAYSGG